ncbi:hypothetical protein J14TS5_55720 [Paenibacillus lautus]|uniref:YxeA family protein n=1 Tax=Paenibacillus lautus TaxID=1401 RepID=UPI001B1573FF|nr:hypothetical protein J14TS5_55720 [Paenibacillus lautus]
MFMSTVKLTSDLPMGKETYYTIVDWAAPGIGDNGRYIYVSLGYTNEGKPKRLSFSSSKPIPNGAYLKLYVSIFRGVTDWEEVTAHEMPVRAKQLTSKSRKDTTMVEEPLRVRATLQSCTYCSKIWLHTLIVITGHFLPKSQNSYDHDDCGISYHPPQVR